MSSRIIFEEIQGFVKKGLQLFLKSLCGIVLFACLLALVFRKENNTDVFIILAVFFVIIVVISLLGASIKMTTQIREDGIYIRFAPFHRTFKNFPWDAIDQLYIREYNPVREYSGWGIRLGPSGRAFNISGNTGIQLVLKDGSRILIGTNMPDDIRNILFQLGQTREPSSL